MPASAIAIRKRHQIVETAYRLFKRDGFHATGLDTIIAEAGVAKMTVYRHFPRKDDLIVSVLDWRAERFDRQLDRLADSCPKAEAVIEAIFDWHGRWFGSPDFHGCLFQHALAEFGDPEHVVFKAVMRQKRSLQMRLEDLLQRIMPADRAQRAALTFSMLIEGATLLAQMGQAKIAIDAARRGVSEILATEMRR